VVLVPRGGLLVELDVRVVEGRGVDQAGDGLLEGVVEDGLVDLGEGEALVRVRDEGGLGVVQEAGPDGDGRDDVVVGDEEVDAGRRGPLRAVLEQDLGERVRRRVGADVLVCPREEAHAGRGLDPPGGEVEGLAERDEGGLGHAPGLEVGEQAGRLAEGGGRGLHVYAAAAASSGGWLGWLGWLDSAAASRSSSGWLYRGHNARELRGQAYLPDARDDLVEARAAVRGPSLVCAKEEEMEGLAL